MKYKKKRIFLIWAIKHSKRKWDNYYAVAQLKVLSSYTNKA